MTTLADIRTSPKRAADKALGLAVAQQLAAQDIEQRELAGALGIDTGAMSRKVRGLANWSLAEILMTAEFFGLSVADLMPTWHEKAPESENGFEGWVPAPYVPGLSRLRESNSRPFHYE